MPTILIVDDDVIISTRLEELLGFIGYDVVGVASSGEDGVEKARKLNPDLILMDIVMPGGMDGIDAAGEIKAELDIPVIFLTGHAEERLVERAKVVEPLGYILKPFQESQIKAAIDVALYKKDMERRLKETQHELERKVEKLERIEKELRASQLWLNSIFNSLDEAVLVITPDRKLVNINEAAQRMFGYSAEELSNSSTEVLHIDHDHFVEFGKKIQEAFDTGKNAGFEFQGRRKNGEIFPTEHTVTLLRDDDGETAGMVSVIRDITDRKLAEEELRLVSSSLLTVQERERKRISLELHDEVGQSLVVLKLQLRSIQGRLEEGQTGLRSDCQAIQAYIVRLIENIRRICKDLTPGILDDLGLTAGIYWLVENVLESHDMDTSVDITNIDMLLTNEQQLLVFRIFQEAFTNMVRHSLASHASIVIKKQVGEISFVIEDDGKGFDVKKATGRDFTKKGMGLGAMEERARMLGGSVNIWSQRELGTRIEFWVPID